MCNSDSSCYMFEIFDYTVDITKICILMEQIEQDVHSWRLLLQHSLLMNQWCLVCGSYDGQPQLSTFCEHFLGVIKAPKWAENWLVIFQKVVKGEALKPAIERTISKSKTNRVQGLKITLWPILFEVGVYLFIYVL